MSQVIIAADGLDLSQCLSLTSIIGYKVNAIKIHDIYDQHGPIVVQQLLYSGVSRVWVDLKLHDIPKTVKLRARAIAKSGAKIITVHALGEADMMAAAVEGVKDCAEIYAVTILTSLNEQQVLKRFGGTTKEVVFDLAIEAEKAGVHGIVCSPQEVEMLAQAPELKRLKLITPGIRSAGKETHDQKRFDTPTVAIKAGAHYLVVGRQITEAPDPLVALEEIEDEIAKTLTI